MFPSRPSLHPDNPDADSFRSAYRKYEQGEQRLRRVENNKRDREDGGDPAAFGLVPVLHHIHLEVGVVLLPDLIIDLSEQPLLPIIFEEDWADYTRFELPASLRMLFAVWRLLRSYGTVTVGVSAPSGGFHLSCDPFPPPFFLVYLRRRSSEITIR